MTRYVVLHKLSRGFNDWHTAGGNVSGSCETVPTMNKEFTNWYKKNIDQVKAVHSQRMVETDRTMVALEFHNEEDALLCMLTFS